MDCNDELKEIDFKNHTCYYFYDIIKVKDFDFNNILIDEKSYGNILVCKVSKLWLVQNNFVLSLIK